MGGEAGEGLERIGVGQKPVKAWDGTKWVIKPSVVGPAAPDAGLLTSYTPGTDRNDFDGGVCGVRLGIR